MSGEVGGGNGPGWPILPPVPPADGIGAVGIGVMGIGDLAPPSIFATPQADLDALSGASGGTGANATPGPFDAAVKSLRDNQLMRLGATLLGNSITLSDEYIQDSLLAAEADVERELRVFLTPREIIPDGTPYAEVQALAAQGVPMVEEPGYPYDTGIFQGMDLELRHRPIIAVRRVWYAYQGDFGPAPASVTPLYDIPLDWVQMDRKYGRINLLPTSNFTYLPLNAFLLSALGAGREIPFGLKVRYSAGLRDARRDYPDLLILIKRKAVLSMLNDRFIPQSGSVSADGLSQSLSFDMAKYGEGIEMGLSKIASQLKGIRLTVLG